MNMQGQFLKLPDIKWEDESLFFTYVWRDETSSFDTHPSVRWEGGSEYYSREFKARIPLAFKGCRELIDMFIEWMQDNHPDLERFWVL